MKAEIDFAAVVGADQAPLWNSGPPPRVGWHTTSMEGVRSLDMQRYWHGALRGWSAPCYSDDPEFVKMRAGGTPSESPTADIEWLDGQ